MDNDGLKLFDTNGFLIDEDAHLQSDDLKGSILIISKDVSIAPGK